MNKNNFQPLKGFRDFLPGEMLERQRVFSVIRNVFERYGFLPMSTPVLEYKEVLAGKYGDEGDKLMYQFVDRGEREVAMRYDLTVPLARYIASHQNDLPVPFKRYQIDMVWRADKPQKGRYREFYQCDIDSVGADSLVADAECIACVDEVLGELGVSDRIVRINNRKMLDGMMAKAGIEKDKRLVAVRAMDKLEKQGEDAVRGELAANGIQTAEADALFDMIKQDFQSADDLVSKFDDIDGAGELAGLVEILLSMGIKNYQIDLTLARGMDYYTGTIAEFIIPDVAEFGSVAGGGRYDKLLGMFAKKEIPAVGMSIGIDRLLAALEEMELVKYDLVSDVLICNLEESFLDKYLSLTRELRKDGIKTDFYYQSDKLEKQLKYANKKNINYAIILGMDENSKNEVMLKNMIVGSQHLVKFDMLVENLKKELNL